MKICTNILGHQSIYPTVFNDPLTFPLASPASQQFYLFSELSEHPPNKIQLKFWYRHSFSKSINHYDFITCIITYNWTFHLAPSPGQNFTYDQIPKTNDIAMSFSCALCLVIIRNCQHSTVMLAFRSKSCCAPVRPHRTTQVAVNF